MANSGFVDYQKNLTVYYFILNLIFFCSENTRFFLFDKTYAKKGYVEPYQVASIVIMNKNICQV